MDSNYDDDDDAAGCYYSGGAKARTEAAVLMQGCGVTLTLVQRPPAQNAALWASGDGAVLWEGAHALIAHLDRTCASDGLRGARCIDLGAGTGACGLACAALGASFVLLTDRAAALPLLSLNAQATPSGHLAALSPNALAAGPSSQTPAPGKSPARVEVRELEWGDAAHTADLLAEHGPFDMAIASECAYRPRDYAPLARTIRALVAPGGRAVLSWAKRGRAETELAACLRCEGFGLEWQRVVGHGDVDVVIARAAAARARDARGGRRGRTGDL